jgi:hypothetical protein
MGKAGDNIPLEKHRWRFNFWSHVMSPKAWVMGMEWSRDGIGYLAPASRQHSILCIL